MTRKEDYNKWDYPVMSAESQDATEWTPRELALFLCVGIAARKICSAILHGTIFAADQIVTDVLQGVEVSDDEIERLRRMIQRQLREVVDLSERHRRCLPVGPFPSPD